MTEAKSKNCDVAHFPEACLSGYAGSDLISHDGFDWRLLAAAMRDVLAASAELRLWVVLGSTRRLSGNNKPHNSLYIIGDEGKIVDRYDKRFCSGNAAEETGELRHYSPGAHFCVFNLKGILDCTPRLRHGIRDSRLPQQPGAAAQQPLASM